MPTLTTIAQELYAARRAVRPVALPTQRYPQLTLDEAYAIQRELVRCVGGTIRGYKIGFGRRDLASEHKQIGFGALLADMQGAPDGTIDSRRFVQLVSENEIAVVMGEDITSPIDDFNTFATKIAGIAGAIEMPDKCYQPFEAMTAVDLFANGAIAGAFIVGPAIPLAGVRLETIAVTTTRDDVVVDSGHYTNIPQSPLVSAHWLATELLRQGSSLRRGDVILTGSMGQAIPALPGRYTSRFTDLPPIHFQVV